MSGKITAKDIDDLKKTLCCIETALAKQNLKQAKIDACNFLKKSIEQYKASVLMLEHYPEQKQNLYITKLLKKVNNLEDSLEEGSLENGSKTLYVKYLDFYPLNYEEPIDIGKIDIISYCEHFIEQLELLNIKNS